MDLEAYSILETTGAVFVTMFLVSVIKKTGVSSKFLPLLSVATGIIVVAVGSMSGLLPMKEWSTIWYGIITGILATGGWSGAKNVLEGLFTDEDEGEKQ